MNGNQTTDSSIPDTKTKPGKFWLWGVAVFQLLAVFIMSCVVGVDETMAKLCGFAILTLCGSMDIKAMKKAGYHVPFWWWGLAVFLPPVYLICRVCKTDTAPSGRVKRFAPALVWVVLFSLLMVAMWSLAMKEAKIQEINRKYMVKSVNTWISDYFLWDSELTVDEVVDVIQFPPNNPRDYSRKGQALVRLSTSKGRPASAILRYDFEESSSAGLDFSINPADEAKLQELKEKAKEQ